MRKRLIALSLIGVLVSLTGCTSAKEISNLNNMGALNSESSVSSSYSLSWTDEQDMVYAQVSSRQLLDLSGLEACSDNEIQQVVNYMNQVDNQLTGKIGVQAYEDPVTKFIVKDMVSDDAVIDSYMTDYLLSFFEKTPYYWQRSKTTIRGIDPGSRSIIVDVEYKTLDFEKDLKEDSTIVRGEPNYDVLMQTRFTKWCNILSTRINNPMDEELPLLESEFEQYYGDPEEILEEQQVMSPTRYLYNTGNQVVYNGLIDTAAEQTGGTCTVRYILIPDYVLGINLGVTCEHMYITDFKLDSDITEDLKTFTKEGYATVTDSVYSLVYSYFTCMDEYNFDGMYKLTNDFKALDKYYEDVFSCTYMKHDGFSVSLFDITGTHITCGVTVSTKERARGSNMTFPIYTDKYFMELELVDGVLKVSNMVHLSRSLEGEPAITTSEADVSGFSATIELNNDDKLAIENLICEFSALQLLGDTTSDKFSDVVDISISTNQLSNLQKNMDSLTGAKKVVFLQNYQQGTANYASVRCRELFQDESNAIVEATATYEFILKGGKWYVYNYDVNSSVRIDTTNLNTTGSLCLVSPGKVEAYTSQIKSTESTSIDSVSDTSVAFDHEAYTPQLKSGIQEQGYNKLSGSDINADLFNEVATTLGLQYSYDQFRDICDSMRNYITANESDTDLNIDEYEEFVFDCVAIVYNQNDGRYMEGEEPEITSFDVATRSQAINSFSGTLNSIDQEVFKPAVDILSVFTNRFRK